MLLLSVLALISAVATIAGIGYCVVCIWAAIRFAARQRPPLEAVSELPAVSILKPLKGSDPELYEALRSHCEQSYPNFEILFGITEADDPAAVLVEQLKQEFPACKMRLILCGKRLGANGKVSTLSQLAPLATNEFLLVNDADIRVQPDYLRTIVGELQPPGVGMVTCLYCGVPADTLGSRLEALGISTDFAPGVLAAWQIEKGLHFGLGSTLAFRRSELEQIGGFEAIVDYLADDYELGRRISGQDLKIELSRAVVETHIPSYDITGFFAHQLRWARTIRASRPGGYIGLLLTFTLPWALATFLLARAANWSEWLLAGALLARLGSAVISCGFALHDRKSLRSLWLLPLRDFMAVVVWIGGLFGNKILWRGEEFSLKNGKLQRV